MCACAGGASTRPRRRLRRRRFGPGAANVGHHRPARADPQRRLTRRMQPRAAHRAGATKVGASRNSGSPLPRAAPRSSVTRNEDRGTRRSPSRGVGPTAAPAIVECGGRVRVAAPRRSRLEKSAAVRRDPVYSALAGAASRSRRHGPAEWRERRAGNSPSRTGTRRAARRGKGRRTTRTSQVRTRVGGRDAPCVDTVANGPRARRRLLTPRPGAVAGSCDSNTPPR
jgi:hypothetical protein